MITLGKNERKLLDKVATLIVDGRYVLASPETLNQAAGHTIIELESPVPASPAAEESKSSFVQQDCGCYFCGKKDPWGAEYTLTVNGGYAGEHDLETVTVEVCGECLEKMLAAVDYK